MHLFALHFHALSGTHRQPGIHSDEFDTIGSHNYCSMIWSYSDKVAADFTSFVNDITSCLHLFISGSFWYHRLIKAPSETEQACSTPGT